MQANEGRRKVLGKKMKIVLGSLAVIAVGFVLFTWWALEWEGVAILETRMADGSVRSTHVWYAEPDGELWVEAGTPQNGWYVDVQKDAVVSFHTPERSGEYLAEPIAGEDAHRRIRRLLQEKYGLRDWWIDILFDTTHSVAVRMVSPSSGP
jgi:hypothetical protein